MALWRNYTWCCVVKQQDLCARAQQKPTRNPKARGRVKTPVALHEVGDEEGRRHVLDDGRWQQRRQEEQLHRGRSQPVLYLGGHKGDSTSCGDEQGMHRKRNNRCRSSVWRMWRRAADSRSDSRFQQDWLGKGLALPAQ